MKARKSKKRPEKRSEKTAEEWWSTSIIDMKPGMIRFRGYAIEDLIGRVGFADMVYLLTRGELPHPEAAKLLEAALVEATAKSGVVNGKFAAIGRAIEAQLAQRAGHPIPMNIDGATGVIYAELGFAPALCRGLFVLSRSVGALAHACEEMQSGERSKGPIPRHLLWTYTGPPPRKVP